MSPKVPFDRLPLRNATDSSNMIHARLALPHHQQPFDHIISHPVADVTTVRTRLQPPVRQAVTDESTTRILVAAPSQSSSGNDLKERVNRSRERQMKRLEEYRKLKAVVPSVRRLQRATKVTIINEAVKYIDRLHRDLLEKMVQGKISPDHLLTHGLLTPAGSRVRQGK